MSEHEDKQQTNLDLQVNAEDGKVEIVHRHGTAPEVNEPQTVRIQGHIDSPFRFYEKQKKNWNMKHAFLEVDTQNSIITLVVDPSDRLAPVVKGAIKMNPHLSALDINTDRTRSKEDFKRLLKRYRFLFEDPSACTEFIADLETLVVNINKELEDTDDSRGNKRKLFEQQLRADLPETIDFYCPIFVEGDKVHIQAEVCFDVTNYGESIEFWLESPELFQTIEEETSRMVAEEVAKFNDEIVTIYQ